MIPHIGEAPVPADRRREELALQIGVLDAEEPAGFQQVGGPVDQTAYDGQPVRSAVQCQRWIVLGHLPVDYGVVRDVRRIAEHGIHRAVAVGEGPRIGGVGLDQGDGTVAGGCPRVGVAASPGDRDRVELDCIDLGMGQFLGDRQGDGPRTSAQICDDRRGCLPQAVDRPPGQQFGLRPRHEHSGAD